MPVLRKLWHCPFKEGYVWPLCAAKTLALSVQGEVRVASLPTFGRDKSDSLQSVDLVGLPALCREEDGDERTHCNGEPPRHGRRASRQRWTRRCCQHSRYVRRSADWGE